MANSIDGKCRAHKDIIIFGTVDTDGALNLKTATGGETSLNSIAVCTVTPLVTTSTVPIAAISGTTVTFTVNGKNSSFIAIGK